MTDPARKYLIFLLAGRRFALDLAQVAEVKEQPLTWPIPTVPRCYTGAMNFHSTIVAVMNLAMFLDLPGPGSTSSEKAIVLDTRIASLAFLVERVIRISSIDQEDVLACLDTAFATARLYLPDGEAILLNAVAIAERAGETING